MMNSPTLTTAPPKVNIAAVREAQAAIAGRIVETPCLASRTMSDLLGAPVWLKFENLQFTASFKERGALNKLLALTPAERSAGVIAVSAGNHAQGVAYHAHRLGIRATIVMPANAPAVKVARVRDFGAAVILHGSSFAEASAIVPGLVERHGSTLLHPFDDPYVIAGQGTVALEMLAAVPELDILVVPVGGGGLVAGAAVAAKALKPSIRIVGVQSESFPGMLRALGREPIGGGSGESGGPSIAEGIAVAWAGSLTSAIVADLVDEVVTVTEAGIEDAIAALLEIEKTLCEGAGAAGIAAMAQHPSLFAGQRTGVVLSGGNIDMSILSAVLQRAQVRRGTIIRLAVDTDDATRALAQVAALVSSSAGTIRSVSQDRVFANRHVKQSRLVIEVELQDRLAGDSMIARMNESGIAVSRG